MKIKYDGLTQAYFRAESVQEMDAIFNQVRTINRSNTFGLDL